MPTPNPQTDGVCDFAAATDSKAALVSGVSAAAHPSSRWNTPGAHLSSEGVCLWWALVILLDIELMNGLTCQGQG